MASSRFFSLSYSLSALGHPVASQGRDGGPSSVRSVAIVFDRSRSLFQAVFFTDGLDIQRLAQDVGQAGYELHSVLPVQPPPGSVPPSAAAGRQRTSASRKAQTATSADAQVDPLTREAARALRAAEAKELLMRILGY